MEPGINLCTTQWWIFSTQPWFSYMTMSYLCHVWRPLRPLSAAQRGVWLCILGRWGEKCSSMPLCTSRCWRCPPLERWTQALCQWPGCSWSRTLWRPGWAVVFPGGRCWGLRQTETQKEKQSQNNQVLRDYGQVMGKQEKHTVIHAWISYLKDVKHSLTCMS